MELLIEDRPKYAKAALVEQVKELGFGVDSGEDVSTELSIFIIKEGSSQVDYNKHDAGQPGNESAEQVDSSPTLHLLKHCMRKSGFIPIEFAAVDAKKEVE